MGKKKYKEIDEEMKDKILMLKRSGFSNQQIYDELWISSSGFYKARKEDQEFDNDWREILNKESVVLCEEKLIERALGQTTWEEIQYLAEHDLDGHFIRWKRANKRIRKIPPSEVALLAYLRSHKADIYGDKTKIELAHAFAAPTPEEAKSQLYKIVNRIKSKKFNGSQVE